MVILLPSYILNDDEIFNLSRRSPFIIKDTLFLNLFWKPFGYSPSFP